MDENVILCKNCMPRRNNFDNDNQSVKTKCRQWLENCEGCDDTSTCYTSSEYASASSKSLENISEKETQNVWYSSLIESLDKVNETTEVNRKGGKSFGNINIHKSRKIHVGNITYITGPVCFNQTVSSKKNSRTTSKIFLSDLSDLAENIEHKENTLIVHLNQTIHVGSKSWRKVFSDCFFGFMEMCMKLVDGA